MTAQWVEAAPITGALRESGTWDGPTATLVDGVFTCDTPEVTVSSTINKDFIIPLPTGIDLSDDTVVYRLMAEIVEKSGGSGSLISTMVAYADPTGNVAESYSQLDFLYPVGTVMTLATSVQQQKYTNNAPPAGNYTRQLVRVMSGADPVVKFTASVLSFGTAVTVPPAHYKVRLTLEKLEAGGGGTPSVLHFRDPADGVFKPLTEIRVPGFDDPPVDYSAARIVWGTDNLIAPDYAAARVAATYGTIPGLRVTPVTDGVRIQADAWHHESGSTPTANIEIPLTWDALTALVADERAVMPTMRLDNVNAGGIITIQVMLANDVMTAGGAGFNLTAGATTVGQDLAVVNSPGATVSRDPILNTLNGANPRIIYKISYMAFGPTDFPAMDVTVRHISIVAQEVVAP